MGSGFPHTDNRAARDAATCQRDRPASPEFSPFDGITGLDRARNEQKNPGADDTEQGTRQVPAIRPLALDRPRPDQRRHDVGTSIGRTGPT